MIVIAHRLGFSEAGFFERRQKDADVAAAIARGRADYIPKEVRTKRCSRCGKTLMKTEFHRQGGRFRSPCKQCRSSQKSKYKSRQDRFWKTLEKKTIRQSNGCLIWQGATGPHDLPMCTWMNKAMSVRRLIWTLVRGEPKSDEFVFTACKNKLCVNHYHFELGTKEDREALRANSMPTGERHRSVTSPETILRGEQCHNAKLNNRLVIEIRERIKTVNNKSQLARDMKLPRGLIRSALNGWKHVE